MYDAIIVGARCAGSATAMLLARQGHSVLVVDRAEFPSDTFSTHFVTAPGTALLERWGVTPRLEERGVPFFDHILLNIAGNVMNTSEVFGPLPVCSPRRTDLDTVLRDMAVEAGAEVRMQTTVTEVMRGDDGRVTGVRLRDAAGNATEEAANIVVGADGRTSVVARSVEPAVRDEHRIYGDGLFAYFDDFEYTSEAAGFMDGGFLFAFPTGPKSACVGTEITNSRNAEIHADPEKVFLERMAHDPDLLARVEKATRDGRWRFGELMTGFFRRAAGPGWALVGDAACTKDPLLGHGITDSFVGAELLAQAIHGDALDKYDDALWRQLSPIYEASRDAAIDFDKSGDELFAAVLPAQMMIRDEYEMVAAGGPTL
ncbi:MAG TPA: NAD(P)/FAD-dependent oxidoreductase [Acidimicrobiales bacterium]|nr:NAD(P)/FAD-dependent oxidoreductase [Acidimicrobiales bacterium]